MDECVIYPHERKDTIKYKPPLLHTNGLMRFYIQNLEKLGGEVPMDEWFLHVFSHSMPNSTPELEIHDHPFHFTSEILHGSFIHKIYKPVIDRDGEYRKVTPLPGKRMHLLGEHFYSLEVLETPHYKRGDKYEMLEDSVHKITSYEDGTVTKVVRMTDQQHCPVVYLHEKYWADYSLKDDPTRYIDSFVTRAQV